MTTGLGQKAVDQSDAGADDSVLWSVTTIIGILHKEGLLYWSAEQAAITAIDSTATWQAMLQDEGRDAAVKWLRDARLRIPKTTLSAAKLGTVVHQTCETYALTGTRPHEDEIADWVRAAGSSQTEVWEEAALVVRMLDRFDEWLQRFTPSYQATEVCVYNPDFGYAGTADAFLTIGKTRLLADYKSTRQATDAQGRPRSPYVTENALQLAAYRHAPFAAVWRPRRTEKFRRRYYLLNQDERALAVPTPEVDGGIVIQITPESCEAFPMRCDDLVFDYFLNCLEVFRWVHQDSPDALGDPLQ